MANKKTSELPVLSNLNANVQFVVLDVNDISEQPTGRVKKVDVDKVIEYIGLGSVAHTKKLVTSLQILNSFTTPIELIASPGAGKFINFLAISFKMQYNSIAYIANTSGQIARIGAQSPISSFDFDQSTNQFGALSLSGTNQLAENEAFLFSTFGGNPVDGNSEIEFYLTYEILDI